MTRLIRSRGNGQRTTADRLRTLRCRPKVELLEDRRLLAPYVVDNVGDAPGGTCDVLLPMDCSLRSAIERANATPTQDTISFDPTILSSQLINLDRVLPDLEDSNLSGPDVRIIGPTPTPTATLTVQRSFVIGTPDFRIFKILDGAEVTIQNLAIKNGKTPPGSGPSYDGGGIHNAGTLLLQDTIVEENTATRTCLSPCDLFNPSIRGGGIFNAAGSALTLVRSTVRFNSIETSARPAKRFQGGGIFNAPNATLEVAHDSTITRNHICQLTCLTTPGSGTGRTVFTGGGIANTRGAVIIRFSTVSDNSVAGEPVKLLSDAKVEGGGIYSDCERGGPDYCVRINSSTISGNRVKITGVLGTSHKGSPLGGGISSYGQNPKPNVRGSTVFGKGIMINSTVSGNVTDSALSVSRGESRSHGAGMFVKFASFEVYWSTIAFNESRGNDNATAVQSGGIQVANPTRANLYNSIVANNTILVPPHGMGQPNDINCLFTSLGWNLLEKRTDICVPVSTDIYNRDPNLAPDLAPNGATTTNTHKVLPGSPVINRGNNASPVGTDTPPFDQRGPGFPREVGQIDIGAYECQPGECGLAPLPPSGGGPKVVVIFVTGLPEGSRELTPAVRDNGSAHTRVPAEYRLNTEWDVANYRNVMFPISPYRSTAIAAPAPLWPDPFHPLDADIIP